MARTRVVLAYPYGQFEPQFVNSLAFFLAYDAKSHRYVVDGGFIPWQTTNLPHGRNQIVRRFLDQLDHCDWLWFVDTDQDFEPDTLHRMLQSADPKTRPILGALVYSYDVSNPDQRVWPTVYSWTDDGPARWSTAPRNRLLGPAEGVAATGTGCVLIHRSVLEAMRDKYGDTSWPWFKYGDIVMDGKPDVFGEDLTFMARAGALGFPVHVDTRIVVGHVKRQNVGWDTHLRDLSWERILPETYVVMPVKNRLDLTKRIVRQLQEQGGYDGLFVFDNGSAKDTRDWLARQRDVEVFDAAGANIHQMWNAGVREALSRHPKANVAILNNDLVLGDGFLEGLARVLRSAECADWVAVAPNYDGRELDGVQQVQGISAARYDGTGGLPGFAFMVRGELFAAGFPWFDEQLQWWFGDNDFCLNADVRGLKYGIVGGVSVEHVGGGSQSGRIADEVVQADRAYFMAKWGAAEKPA